MEPIIEPLTVTLPAVIKMSGLGRTTINKLCNAGTIKKIKIGKRSLYDVESIRRLLGKDCA